MKFARNTAVLSWLLIFFLASSGVNLISHTCHTCGCKDYHLFVKPYCCGNEKCHEGLKESCDDKCPEEKAQKGCCTFQFNLIKIKSAFTSVERTLVNTEMICIPNLEFSEIINEEIVSASVEEQSKSPPLIFYSGKQFVIFTNSLRIPFIS